jgi:hypothetical protein
MLAHKYEVKGVKEWLVEHGITVDSVCAAMSFACDSVQDVSDGLLEGCQKHASWSLTKLSEGGLVGVPALAARELLRAHAENQHLGRVCDVAEGFKYVQRWVRSNEGRGMFTSAEEAAESLIEMLELSRLPRSFLSGHVQESGLVSQDRLRQIHDEVVTAERKARPPNKVVRPRCVGHVGYWLDNDGDMIETFSAYCLGGTGAHARLAVVDDKRCCVCVFSLEEVKCLWKVGRKGKGPGEFMFPTRAMFDGRGHLWVADSKLKTLQTFDCEGNFVGCIREEGSDAGDFFVPDCMELSAQGDILMYSYRSNRVVVCGLDGTLLCMVPAAHDQHGIEIDTPFQASPWPDGNIMVMDRDCMRLFSADGLFLKEIMPPEIDIDEPWPPYSMCTGSNGELVTVGSEETHRVYIRDVDCGLLCSMEEPFLQCKAIKMDHKGRLFCQAFLNNVEIWEFGFDEGS